MVQKKRRIAIEGLLPKEEQTCPHCGAAVSAFSGAKLRQLRVRAGLSLRETARRAELSAPYVSDLELGRRRLGLGVADRLLRAIGE